MMGKVTTLSQAEGGSVNIATAIGYTIKDIKLSLVFHNTFPRTAESRRFTR